MKVYKFGGASVKDAAGVRNVLDVLKQTGKKQTLVVVSAMGKTTNAFEEVLNFYFKEEDYGKRLGEIKTFHIQIAEELLDKSNPVFYAIDEYFLQIDDFLLKNKSPNYDYVYDQIISYGELLSSQILSAFLNQENLTNDWIDVRDYIKTDSSYREAKVDWETTCDNLQKLKKDQLYITQGFIGSNENYFTTTLGREGSDYSGAIIAYCLNAFSLTIWKDVPGVLNADPRYFENASQLMHISYEEAIELAYYGASVIHPKTLQPLQRKQIPLFVKSFENPELPGTEIKNGQALDPTIPCFIVKKNQTAITISTHDFAFIDESVLRDVFDTLTENQLKVNLIQISAISLSLCLEDKFNTLKKAIEVIKKRFKVTLYQDCSLYTIRHADQNSLSFIPNTDRTIIKQAGVNTLQLVIKQDE